MYQQPITKESFHSCGKGRHTAYSSKDHEYAILFRGNGSFLTAGKNIEIGTVAKEKHAAVAYGDSGAEIHGVQNQQSPLAGENVTLLSILMKSNGIGVSISPISLREDIKRGYAYKDL